MLGALVVREHDYFGSLDFLKEKFQRNENGKGLQFQNRGFLIWGHDGCQHVGLHSATKAFQATTFCIQDYSTNAWKTVWLKRSVYVDVVPVYVGYTYRPWQVESEGVYHDSQGCC